MIASELCPPRCTINCADARLSEKSDVVMVSKVAVTDTVALIVTLQGPVPEQAPLQPAKVEPEAGEAVSVTVAPGSNTVEHTLGQSIPEGLVVTVPVPLPDSATVSAKLVDVPPSMTDRLSLPTLAA